MTTTAEAVKERPIPLRPEDVRAVLDGRKTQHRVIVKPQPEPHADFGGTLAWTGKILHPGYKAIGVERVRESPEYLVFPFGRVGDRLWVKEAHTFYREKTAPEQKQTSEVVERFMSGNVPADGIVDAAMSIPMGTGPQKVLYKADFGDWADNPDSDLGPWRSPIFMPREFSRITLAIESVRVQRLNEITHRDALAEGVEYDVSKPDGAPLPRFRALWEKINGKGSWAASPWIWCLTFSRV